MKEVSKNESKKVAEKGKNETESRIYMSVCITAKRTSSPSEVCEVTDGNPTTFLLQIFSPEKLYKHW